MLSKNCVIVTLMRYRHIIRLPVINSVTSSNLRNAQDLFYSKPSSILTKVKWLFSVYKVLSFNFTNRVLDKCDCEEPCNKIVYETKAHYTKLAYDDIVAADIYFPTLTYTEFIELPTYQTIDFISEFSHFLQGPADQKQDQEKLRNCCATRFVLSMSQAVRRSLIIEINITGWHWLYFKNNAINLGNVGGQLGLWVGMSIVSLFELFQFIILKIHTLLYKIIKSIRPKYSHPNL